LEATATGENPVGEHLAKTADIQARANCAGEERLE
jgi:hypothetical protein